MMTSESINELATALSAAQGEMVGAIKDSTNPHFRSQYSDLSSVITAIKGPFTKHGLAYIQGTGQLLDGCVMITTRIVHKSGQWIESTSAIPIGPKVNAQTYGSACSYGRRYGLQALAGVPSVDDDGQMASAAPVSAPGLSDQQVTQLKGLLGQLPGEVTVNFLRAINAAGVENVPADKYDWACAALRKKIAELPQ